MRNDTKLDLLWDDVQELKASSGGSDLPDVTAADNGKLLGVVNGAWNKMDAPIGGVDYSTTEQDTGLKWINGKEIFQKTFENIGTYSDQNQMDTGIPITEDIIDYSMVGIVTLSDVNYAVVGSNVLLSISQGGYNPGVFILKGSVNYMAYYNGPTMTGNVTIRYTKTPATRTKKKTTTK